MSSDFARRKKWISDLVRRSARISTVIHRTQFQLERCLKPQPPVIVMSIGKTGTSSVTHSLEQTTLRRKIYHLHHLSSESIENAARFHQISSGLPGPPKRIVECRLLANELDYKHTGHNSRPWDMISLVRDPVACNISGFFQAVEHWYPNLVSDWVSQGVSVIQLIETFFDEFPHTWPLDWFNQQIRDTIGIDILDEGFDREKGFKIYENKLARILVVRLEDLNRVGEAAIAAFLGLSAFRLSSTNIGSQKYYAEIYREFKQQIIFPEKYLDKMYGSKYAQVFYSSNEIAAFRRQWAFL